MSQRFTPGDRVLRCDSGTDHAGTVILDPTSPPHSSPWVCVRWDGEDAYTIHDAATLYLQDETRGCFLVAVSSGHGWPQNLVGPFVSRDAAESYAAEIDEPMSGLVVEPTPAPTHHPYKHMHTLYNVDLDLISAVRIEHSGNVQVTMIREDDDDAGPEEVSIYMTPEHYYSFAHDAGAYALALQAEIAQELHSRGLHKMAADDA